MRREFRKGDPCPCCGSPIQTDNEVTLSLLTVLAERMGLPLPAAPEEKGNDYENADCSGRGGAAAPAGGVGGDVNA